MRLNKLPSWSGRTLHFYLEFTPNSMPSSATSRRFWDSVPCISHWLFPGVQTAPCCYQAVKARDLFPWAPWYNSAYNRWLFISKNAGDLRRSPAVATRLPRRRFAFFISRFVSFRLGLATLFTRPRIVEGYTLYRFRWLNDPSIKLTTWGSLPCWATRIRTGSATSKEWCVTVTP